MSQVQQTPNIYKPGIKQHVSFTSLKQLEKYEPNIFKLFRQIKDGERVEMAEYDYRLRDSSRFGISVTRFAKDQQLRQLTTENVDSGADIRKELRGVWLCTQMLRSY